MAFVGLLLSDRALAAGGFALLVCGAGELVFHLAAEGGLRVKSRVGWLRCLSSGGSCGRGRGGAGMWFVVAAALGFDVCAAGGLVEGLDARTFLRAEGVHVFFVVVGVLPDGTGWVAVGVDEELVVDLTVVLSKPPRW